MNNDKPIALQLSKLISFVVNPFLTPLYVILLIFATGYVPLYLTPQTKRYIYGLVVICTVALPAMMIILLKLFGVIKSYGLVTRKERVFPLFIGAASYLLCAILLANIPMAFLVRKCMLAATLSTLYIFVINFQWQVSVHMTAIGGALGIIFTLLCGGFSSLIWVFCIGMLLAGALGSARLYLNKHTMGQVTAGFFGGFAIGMLTMLFIP